MESGRGWGIDPMQTEGYKALGQREQNAVNTALRGISTWVATGNEPRQMRVTVTPERGFDMKAFANVLHELRIGVVMSDEPIEDPNMVVFQPTPYSGIPNSSRPNRPRAKTLEELKQEIFDYESRTNFGPDFWDFLKRTK
ncbi:MAG TPA: hypothetical protein VG965_01655 [Patescibacteria group bacterium]|nr:hypothetical protein [Patescibacteria group bacterium]